MKGTSMKATKVEQPTYPFLFAARTYAADTHSEKLVLYHLISRMRDGTCFPKQDAIAYAELITTRAVQYGIAALKAKGVITIEKSGRNNVYVLHLDALNSHQRPPMPETKEPMEPPTAKNIFIGGIRVGRANQGSPIESEEHTNHDSPVSGIGETSDVNTRSQSTCKKTEKKTSKEKKTTIRTPDNGEPTQPGDEEVSVSEDQGTQGRVNPILPTKPGITMERAQKILNVYADLADLNDAVICADCTSIGKIEDGRCTFCDADGSVCGGSHFVNKLEWMNLIRDQWDKYNKQVLAVAGVPLKDTVGLLRLDSMERQEEIIKCRRLATVLSVAKRRHWAKQMFDSGNRFRVRKAWYMYASGMLDDDAGEPGPWVTQFFAELEALQPRDGGTK